MGPQGVKAVAGGQLAVAWDMLESRAPDRGLL
jgi:hypothetical protein